MISVALPRSVTFDLISCSTRELPSPFLYVLRETPTTPPQFPFPPTELILISLLSLSIRGFWPSPVCEVVPDFFVFFVISSSFPSLVFPGFRDIRHDLLFLPPRLENFSFSTIKLQFFDLSFLATQRVCWLTLEPLTIPSFGPRQELILF